MCEAQKLAPWWERGVIYQIYPRSFQDSDADGVGDLAGIESRLDYLAGLGIDAIWLSPIYPSPMADFGYDISDYCDIDPMFGDLAAFDRLLAAIHARGLKLVLDFVPNHSSDQHPWFIESRVSRDNPKRNWYIWREPAPDGGPPNNWISDFGGSSWEWDESTGQYYLHAFLKEQPDLNWREPRLREAMMGVLRFWLDRGVDGFRMDVLWHIIKADGLPNNPINADWTPDRTQRDRLLQLYSTDQPEAHAISAEFRALADSYGDRLLVGEISLPNDRLARWYGTPEHPQVHLPSNFQLIESAWDAARLRRSHDALSIGDITLVESAEDVLAYQRRYAGESLLIALNLGDQPRPLPQVPSLSQSTSMSIDSCVYEVLVSTLWPSSFQTRPLDGTLAPNEGLILRLKEER